MALNRVSIASRGYRCNGGPTRTAISVRGYRCPIAGAVVIPVPIGSIFINGLVPDVFTPRVVDIPTGAMLLNGLQPFATLGDIINVPTGALSLDGLPPVIIISSGDTLIAVPTGQLLLQGIPPEVLLEIIAVPFDEQRKYLVARDNRIYCQWGDDRISDVPASMRIYSQFLDNRNFIVGPEEGEDQ